MKSPLERQQNEQILHNISQSRLVPESKNYDFLYPDSKNRRDRGLKAQIKEMAVQNSQANNLTTRTKVAHQDQSKLEPT